MAERCCGGRDAQLPHWICASNIRAPSLLSGRGFRVRLGTVWRATRTLYERNRDEYRVLLKRGDDAADRMDQAPPLRGALLGREPGCITQDLTERKCALQPKVAIERRVDSSGATHRPAEEGRRRRFAAAQCYIDVVSVGAANATHLPKICTPLMLAPFKNSAPPPVLSRRVCRAPQIYLQPIWGRTRNGRRAARRIGRMALY